MVTVISIDGEFTGPNPGLHSMISFGAAAFTGSGECIEKIRVNMHEQEGALRDKPTMDWWEKHPVAWSAATHDPCAPRDGMRKIAAWFQSFAQRGPVCVVGWRLPIDHEFLAFYWSHYLRKTYPYKFDAEDIYTVAKKLSAEGGLQFQARDLLWSWRVHLGLDSAAPSHIAEDDAFRQGVLYFALSEYMRANLTKGRSY